MRSLLLALMFACLLAAAALVDVNQQAYAQGTTCTIVVKKIVNGMTPESDWEFLLIYSTIFSETTELDGGYSTTTVYTSIAITISKAGGEEAIKIEPSYDLDHLTATFSESVKPNYIVHVRTTKIEESGGTYVQTNVVEIPLSNAVGPL